MILKLLVVLLVFNAFANGFPKLQNAKNNDNATGEYIAEENLGNKNVLEGDIMLDKSTRNIVDELKSNARDAMTNKVKHWPNRQVPYLFGGVSSKVRSVFQAAIADFHRYTCLRFTPRTNQRDYIYVVNEGGCWSKLGRSGGQQKLSLGRGCEHKGTAIHEIMHAMGFFHEQSRIDRDNFITIVWSNIRSDMRRNFEKYRHGQADTLGAPYDYKSVMHYPPNAFSTNGQRTIIPKQAGVQLGQRSGFSSVDLQQLNKLYCSGGVATRAPVVGCGDSAKYSRSCPSWAKKQYCQRSSKYYKFMTTYCKKSCGQCTQIGCGDSAKYSRSCPGWAKKQYCQRSSKYYKFMTTNCKKSCGQCTQIGCGDSAKYSRSCPGWASKLYCQRSSKYYKFMTTNCKKSCGQCTQSSCQDKRRECPQWKSHCHSSSRWYSFMMRECKRTCGKC